MPTSREIIVQMVDEKIAAGIIAPALRDQTINTLTANEQMATAWAADLMRGADYTNKTKQFADERRRAAEEAQRERQAIQQERQRLQDWERTAQGRLSEADQLRAQHTALAAKAAAMEQTLRDYNMLDYVSVPAHQEPPPTPRPAATSSNPSMPPGQTPWIGRDEANAALQGMFQINGKVLSIVTRHQQLFGEPLQEDLYSHYLSTGQDPEEYWKAKYGVDMRVSELQMKQREAEIARIREEERAKLMSELSMDPSRVVGAPFNGNRGAVNNPVLEAYAHSRATQHAENGANLDAATGTEKWIAPEMKPEIAMARDRVSKASEMFVKNFDVTGRPISDEGRQLYQKHLVTE